MRDERERERERVKGNNGLVVQEQDEEKAK
jgi:hypothetical protein